MNKTELLSRIGVEDLKGLTVENLRSLILKVNGQADVEGKDKKELEEMLMEACKMTEVRVKDLKGKDLERMEFIKKIAANMDNLPANMHKYTTMVNRIAALEVVDTRELLAVCKCLSGGLEASKEVMFTSKKQIHAIRKSLLKNESRSFLSIEFFNAGVDEEEVLGYKVAYATAPLSPLNRGFEVEDEIIVPVSSKSCKVIRKDDYAPFIKGLAKIHFATPSFIELFKNEGIFVVINGIASRVFIPSNKKNVMGDRLWYDPNNVDDLKSVNELKNLTVYNKVLDIEEKLDVRHYDFLSFSPSDTRIGNGMMLDITNGDNRVEFLDSITGKAWTLETENIAAKVEKGADEKILVLKTMPRFGQKHAGSVNFGKFNNWAMFTTNFETTDGETADGTGFILDEAFARMVSKRSGKKATPASVRGLFIQARPLLFKGAFLIISRKMMKKMYKKHVAIKDEDGKSLVTNYGVIENDCPEFFVDSNIVKAKSEFSKFADCLELELLDIAKASDSSLSKQLIEKALVNKPEETKAWLSSYMTKTIYNQYVDRFVNKTVKVPTLGQIANPFTTDIIESIAPTFAKENGAIYKTMLDNQIQASVKALDKMKFGIEGKNVRLISEHTELFSEAKSLIKYGEIYSPSANTFFRKNQKDAESVAEEAKKAIEAGEIELGQDLSKLAKNMAKKENYIVTIKYPSMGVKEYYYAKALTLQDIKERVLALNVSKEDKEAIFEYFKSLDKGVTMLPARKAIMRQCAGLDFDYDGWTEIYDYDFVDLLACKEYFIVDCE